MRGGHGDRPSAVDDSLDILCLGEMGIGNTTAAAALCHRLFGGDAEIWVGPGTGVTGDAYSNKIRVVRDAVDFHRSFGGDGLSALCRLGGREMAAIACHTGMATFDEANVSGKSPESG